MTEATGTSQSSGELVVERVLNARRVTVWRAWTEAEQLAKWWGPKGFGMQVGRLELRPGGAFHYKMTAPNGQGGWGILVYEEIHAPEKLVYISAFADEDGNLMRHPLSETWPVEVRNVMTLEDLGDKTKMTMRAEPVRANEAERKTFDEARSNVQQGVNGMLSQLEAHLAGQV